MQNGAGTLMRHTILKNTEYVVDAPPADTFQTFHSGHGAWLSLLWPALACCGVVGAVLLALEVPGGGIARAADRIRSSISSRVSPAKPNADRVLIVTSDPMHELTAIATLSPRGYEPLLAGNLEGVKQQLAAHQARVRFAVIDAAVPGSPAIARSLAGLLPAGRIVMLRPGASRENIGQALLDRL